MARDAATEGVQDVGTTTDREHSRARFFLRSRDLFLIADHDRRFVEVNPAWEEFLGYSADELIGRPYLDFVHPDDHERTIERAEALRRGQPWAEDFDNRYVRRDGSVRWLRWSSVFGQEENLVYAVATDVTELRHADEARRHSKEMLERGEQLAALGSWRLDLASRTWSWSPGLLAVTGIDAGDFDDSFEFTLSLIHPDDRALVRDTLERIGHGEQVAIRYRFFRADGQVRTAETVAGLEPDESGGPGSAAGVIIDVTERLAAEEQERRREAEREQGHRLETVGRLAGGIAHDFNNLLSVILNNAALAADAVPGGSEARGQLDEVDHAARRAAELTHQLVLFSRQEMIEPRVVDPNATLRDADRLLRRTLGEDVALELRLDDGVPCVRIDPGQLERVVVNLAVNARDAMPEGGRLEITTEAVPDNGSRRVRIRVTDTGRGMDGAIAARAFEPFFTTKAAGKGSGLGLATVYGVVSQAGGEVMLESSPGEGTEATITLPGAADLPDEVEGDEPSPAPSPEGARVLVVEDEPSVRRLIARLLTPEGYEVIDAAGPSTALDICAAEAPIDLLLTDVVMPEMSGRELAERLRESQDPPAVLFMSGYTDDVVVRHGVADLSVRFVPKPFTRETLLAAVGHALAERYGAGP